MKKALIMGVIVLLTTASIRAVEDVRVSAGDVTDSRTTGQFFARLEIELKVIGDIVSDAKGIRCHVTKAEDDLGKSLLKDEAPKTEFEDVQSTGSGQTVLKIELNNPSRKAASVKNLAGEFDMLVPKRDKDAVITVSNFMAQSGKPISEKGLKKAKIEMTVLSKDQYMSAQKAQQEKIEKEAAGQVDKELLNAFSGLFGMMEPGENAIIFQIQDPESKVHSIEFTGVDGAGISSNGRMKSGDIIVYEFENPMPKNAKLQVILATKKSIVTVPFAISDINLP